MRTPTIAAILTALGALLVLAPLAQATNDPVGGGQTKLVLDEGFVSFLGKDKIMLSASAPAKLKGSSLTLPVSGGSLDPTTGKGTIEAEGSLVFKSTRKKLPLKAIAVKTKHSPLIAKVGGSQLKLATSPKLAFKREGFGSEFSAQKLKLSAKVAERLNKKLRPELPFKEGQLIGALQAKTQPLTTTILEANRATLVFDPGFFAKLAALHVSTNPIFPAEHVGPTFTFPIIVAGAIAPDLSRGTLRTGGDVELLQLGGGQLFWHEPWLDLGAKVDSAEANLQPSPPFAGKTGRIGIFDLGVGVASADPAARTISLSGAPLSLQASTAGALDQLFAEGKEDFRAGEALGTLSFSAQGQ